MQSTYISRHQNDSAQGIIIQGFCTDYDKNKNVDDELDEEPETAHGDNCMPQSFDVKKNETKQTFLINLKSGSGSPMLRNLSVSNADKRSQYGISVISSS